MTRPVIETFLNYSEEYQVQLSRPDNHGLCITPIRTDRFMARWQVDLVDFRTCPDGEYKWICNVQDHFTKFCWLKPLKFKCAEEVAQVLYELMGTYGSPCILQSDNGKEFRNSVVYNLKKLWHNLKIIHGRPRHPQSQGSVERSNGDIQGILGSWMRDNNSTKWSLALPMVMFTKFTWYYLFLIFSLILINYFIG
jgi:transposase InsO family protein